MSRAPARGRVGVVAEREFLSTVRRRSYLVVTFGMPLFVGAYAALVGLVPAYFMAKGESARREIGLVDLAGVVRADAIAAAAEDRPAGPAEDPDLPDELRPIARRVPERGPGSGILEGLRRPVRFRPYASLEAALAGVGAGEVERFYLVPAGYLASGAIEIYQAEAAVGLGLGREREEAALGRLLQRSLMEERLPREVRLRVEHPVVRRAARAFVVGAGGAVAPFDAGARAARLAIPGAFAVLLFMSLMTSGSYLLQGVVEEKENRVIEVILSSVTPDELLYGKLIGLGAAGLLQLLVWVTVAGAAAGVLVAAIASALNARLVLGCLALFALGFVMIGSLMTGTGAIGATARESQQFAGFWSLVTVLPPALTWMGILEEPNGWLARGLGWFPLTSPIIMMIRIGTGQVPLWDYGVALLGLLAGVVLAVRAAAALFRLGLLRFGRRPRLGEIARAFAGR